MHRFGALVARHRWAVITLWALVVASLVPLAASAPDLLSSGTPDAGTEASRAAQLIRQRFPERMAPIAFVIFESRSVPIEAPGYRAQVTAWRTDLDRLARGKPVVVGGPITGSDHRTVALVLLSNQDSLALTDLGRAVAGLHHGGPARTYVGGPEATHEEGVRDSKADFDMVERLSLPIALPRSSGSGSASTIPCWSSAASGRRCGLDARCRRRSRPRSAPRVRGRCLMAPRTPAA